MSIARALYELERAGIARAALQKYDRIMHSEADRQAYIDTKKAEYAQQIARDLFKVDTEAQEIADQLLGSMKAEQMALAIRALLQMRDADVLQIMAPEITRCIIEVAETRAIHDAENLTPEQLEP